VHRLLFETVLLVALTSTVARGQCTFPASSSASLITYRFEPLLDRTGLALQMTLEFEGGPQGTVNLELPSEWAGQQHVESSITQLRALSPNTTVTDTKSSSKKGRRTTKM
jgi:hypothetical protein